MPAKLDRATEDHAIALYLAGEPTEKIKSDCGVSSTLLHRIRERRGIPPRPRVSVPEDRIVSAYMAGASEYGLSREHQVSRGTIARVLRDAKIERRGMSDAQKTLNAQRSDVDKRSQVQAAHKAARLRRVPEIQKLRHALTIEQAGRSGSEAERSLLEMLEAKGQCVGVERAVGPYNVDLSLLPVAVEVLGGGFHGVKARHRERTPYILDAGWHLVMVWAYEGASALGEGAAEYLVTFVDEVRRHPPATSQYRVISGQGKLLAARSREDNEFPLEPPPRGRLDSGS